MFRCGNGTLGRAGLIGNRAYLLRPKMAPNC
jgi:hypothetical protein